MRPLRYLALPTAFLAGSVLFVVSTGGPAAAHTHPTPVELDSPAAVRVETYAQVSISLIEHNRVGAHIGLTQRTYTPLLTAGSGFAVDPSGGIVTSPKLIDVDLKRAEKYAVNKIFNERYGNAAPMPADPFATQTIIDQDPTDRAAERLQRCYQPNTTDDTGGCVVFSQRVVKVLPFVSDQAKYGNLTATVATPDAGKAEDVVVLKVGASSMPTVNLASSTSGVAAFSTLGFQDVPTTGTSLKTLEGHFAAAGAADVKRDEKYDALTKGIGGGLLGGPVVGELGQVVGFLTDKAQNGAAPDLALVGPPAIRAALTAAGIEAHRGPTDVAYEDAMHNYKNRLYTPSIPSLTQTLKLYPGHAQAAEALTIANRKKGTADEAVGDAAAGRGNGQGSGGGKGGGGNRLSTILPIAIGVLAVLIALLALALFLVKRRRARDALEPDDELPDDELPDDEMTVEGLDDDELGDDEQETARPVGPVPPWQRPTGDRRSPVPPPPVDPHAETVARPIPELDTVFHGGTAVRRPPAGNGPAAAAPARRDPDATHPVSLEELRTDPFGARASCPRCGEQTATSSQAFCANCGQRLR
jgi:hypothetical protein